MNSTATGMVRARALIYGILAVFFFSFAWLGVRLATIASVFDRAGVTNSLANDIDALSSGPLGTALWLQIAIVIVLHLLYAALLWVVADRAMTRLRWQGDRYLNGSFLVILIGIYCMFFLNAWLHPNSQYAALPVFGDLAITRLAAIALLVMLSVTAAYGLWPRTGRTAKKYAAAMGIGLTATLLLPAYPLNDHVPDRPTATNLNRKPDIILIGIDSLRVDDLLTMQGDPPTPNIHALLSRASVFERTYSPLSRTFPAWVSILSGQYPITHGVRANLTAPDRISGDTVFVTEALRAAGYRTVYASDEKLFSNIDESYGFDRVTGPPAGGAEFLISKFNDLPLANLLSNLPAGRLLFPYTVGNRAAYYTYRPDDFSKQLAAEIHASDPEKPLFLATHFCLTHWPYIWRDRTAGNISIDDTEAAYAQSLAALDKQVGELLQHLAAAGRLENSLVILLSDHGEQFRPRVARVFSASGVSSVLDMKLMGGHGTEVLSDEQNRVLIGIKGYGQLQTVEKRHRRSVTSLVDIAPTLLDLAGIDDPDASTRDGISLAPLVNGTASDSGERTVFIESGLAVPAFSKAKINIVEIASQGIDFYRIDGRGHIVIKEEIYDAIVSDKQVSAISKDLQVAVINGESGAEVYFQSFADEAGNERLPSDDEVAALVGELCTRFTLDLAGRTGSPCDAGMTANRNSVSELKEDAG